MNKLPFLISIPHGGKVIPKELKSRIKLSPLELLADGDPYTGDIYDMRNEVVSQLQFDIARALIDVNRAPNDLPPGNPDGVFKTVSIFNNPVYHHGKELCRNEMTTLLTSYYEPYHLTIESVLKNSKILFAFDCHSMEEIGPSVARDAGKKRPLFCLGNNNGNACSQKITRLFAECISKSFSISITDIKINKPFSGGFITQKYGMNPVPWIQVEMNRKLYINEYENQAGNQNIKARNITKLNSSFRRALFLFLKNYI